MSSEPEFEVIPADALGIKGTPLEKEITSEKCILCGRQANMLIYVYENITAPAHHTQKMIRNLHSVECVCDEDCLTMVKFRKM
jgi:hypothetical protein